MPNHNAQRHAGLLIAGGRFQVLVVDG